MILCDVAREDASVIVSDLRELEHRPRGLDRDRGHRLADLRRAPTRPSRRPTGCPRDAVVWEEVESRTSENTELSANFLAFMVARLPDRRRSGSSLDSADPDHRRDDRRARVRPDRRALRGRWCSAAATSRGARCVALAIGFPVGITAAFLFTLAAPTRSA